MFLCLWIRAFQCDDHKMSVSMSTCTAQSDSMQENCSLIVLGKEDGKGEGGITIREGRMGWGWGEGGAD